MKTILSILIILIISSCAATSPLQPSEADLSSSRLKGSTLTELNSGYSLYIQNCAACHKLYDPSKFTVAQWNKILPEMFTKAHLNEETKKKSLITDYVLVKAK